MRCERKKGCDETTDEKRLGLDSLGNLISLLDWSIYSHI